MWKSNQTGEIYRKIRLLINTASRSLVTATLSTKNANSFTMGKPRNEPPMLFGIMAVLKTVDVLIVEICQKCGGTALQRREEGVMGRVGNNFLFLAYELNCSEENANWHDERLGCENGALRRRMVKLRAPAVGYQTFSFIKQNSYGLDFLFFFFFTFFHEKRECPDWKQKRGGVSVVLT